MNKKSIILASEKLKAVHDYLNGEGNTYSIGEK
jgi:hypothetical protein